MRFLNVELTNTARTSLNRLAINRVEFMGLIEERRFVPLFRQYPKAVYRLLVYIEQHKRHFIAVYDRRSGMVVDVLEVNGRYYDPGMFAYAIRLAIAEDCVGVERWEERIEEFRHNIEQTPLRCRLLWQGKCQPVDVHYPLTEIASLDHLETDTKFTKFVTEKFLLHGIRGSRALGLMLKMGNKIPAAPYFFRWIEQLPSK